MILSSRDKIFIWWKKNGILCVTVPPGEKIRFGRYLIGSSLVVVVVVVVVVLLLVISSFFSYLVF